MNLTIDKILIPTDYSPNAKRAMNYGLELAKLMGSEVILYHGYHFPLATTEDMMYIDKMKDGEDKKLAALKNEVMEDYPDLKVDAMIEYGSTVDLIDSACRKLGIDLIVMGTKGESNSIDALFGTIASNVLSKVECSTIVVPESSLDFSINEVLFASDFHETKNFDYLSTLLCILDKTDAMLAIVNVRENVDFKMEANAIEEKIDEIFDKYKHSHHFLEDENIEAALFDFAHLNSCDLIALSTRHYSLWKRIWHSSLTKQLALHSTIPVLVMHEK